MSIGICIRPGLSSIHSSAGNRIPIGSTKGDDFGHVRSNGIAGEFPSVGLIVVLYEEPTCRGISRTWLKKG